MEEKCYDIFFSDIFMTFSVPGISDAYFVESDVQPNESDSVVRRNGFVLETC